MVLLKIDRFLSEQQKLRWHALTPKTVYNRDYPFTPQLIIGDGRDFAFRFWTTT